jgi:hypothetical protein
MAKMTVGKTEKLVILIKIAQMALGKIEKIVIL